MRHRTLCPGLPSGAVVLDHPSGWAILRAMKGMIRNLLALFAFLVLALPAEGQYYDVEERLQEHLANCDAGDKWACGYAISLWMRQDSQSWLTQRNVDMHVHACSLGLDGSCWKFERRLEPNPYAPVRADRARFLPMVEAGCENNSTMACWQAASEYYELGEMERAWDYADRSCRAGFSDGCARRADVEATTGADPQDSYISACHGNRPGYMRKRPYCEAACTMSDAISCRTLADMYARGRDGYQPTDRRERRAAELYERACTLGDSEACDRDG